MKDKQPRWTQADITALVDYECTRPYPSRKRRSKTADSLAIRRVYRNAAVKTNGPEQRKRARTITPTRLPGGCLLYRLPARPRVVTPRDARCDAETQTKPNGFHC